MSQDGQAIASYSYDDDEQRIIKTLTATASDPARSVHYHYDDEGRLISETDGETGEPIRDYVWLGLTPIASYGYEQATQTPTRCNPERIASLSERITVKQARIIFLEARLLIVSERIAWRQGRITILTERVEELQARLAASNPNNTARIERLSAAIARLQTTLAGHETVITDLSARITDLTGRRDLHRDSLPRLEEIIERLQAVCDSEAVNPPAPITNTVITLTLLHADHIGRPVLATDISGAVIWDGGITTPFGQQIASVGAAAQALMFPGQYADVETGPPGATLSHNWHRTYDPTLGRYLQADPIGLTGGLNRYAYVGGNPVSYVDSTGEFAHLVVGFALGALGDLLPKIGANIKAGKAWNHCLDLIGAGLSGLETAFGVKRLIRGFDSLGTLKSLRRFDFPARANRSIVQRGFRRLKSRIYTSIVKNAISDYALNKAKEINNKHRCDC